MTAAALVPDRPSLSLSDQNVSLPHREEQKNSSHPSLPDSTRISETPPPRRQSLGQGTNLDHGAILTDLNYTSRRSFSGLADTDYRLAQLDLLHQASPAAAPIERPDDDDVHTNAASLTSPSVPTDNETATSLARTGMAQAPDLGLPASQNTTTQQTGKPALARDTQDIHARTLNIAPPAEPSFLSLTLTPDSFDRTPMSDSQNDNSKRDRSNSESSSRGRPMSRGSLSGVNKPAEALPDAPEPPSRADHRRVSSSTSPVKAGRRAGLVVLPVGRSRAGSESRGRTAAQSPDKEHDDGRPIENVDAALNGQLWHPLSPVQDVALREATSTSHPPAVVVDDGAVVDSLGQVLTLDGEDDRDAARDDTALQSPRRTQPPPLYLDLKPPSPQPWDLVDPPAPNRPIKTDRYSPPSHRFQTLQSQRRQKLIPHSSYYFGPPPPDSAYGTAPMGHIGIHHPREILRVERDYTGGELIQFAPIYPLELEGRITPTQFLESINAINELLISAHSLRHAFLDNTLAVFTLQLSRVLMSSHYDKEMRRLRQLFEELNSAIYNPVGLNLLWPRKVAFLYLEIEYY